MVVFSSFIPNKNMTLSVKHSTRMGFMVLGLLWVFTQGVNAVRVKDIANLRGARDNQLTGFGLVVGLDGTGDTQESLLSRKPIVNALERMGVNLKYEDIKGRSIAAVWLTAILPSFAKSGQPIDVTVATIGDATSLRGGVLVMTPLRGPDRLVYAVAQGPIVGIPRGISRGEAPLPPEEKLNLPVHSSMVASVGNIPGGALVEREINLNLNSRAVLYMNLKTPDFTTAFRLANVINQELGHRSAKAKDAGTIEISVPSSYLGRTVELVSYIENMEITPDRAAQVVLDERSGTIVMGGDVRISPIAISQGGLNIQVKLPTLPKPEVPADGKTPPTPEAATTIQSNVTLFKGGADLKEIVDGFNKIGVSTDDLIQVLKAIKASGALHAELVIR